MNWLSKWLKTVWEVSAEMAPYLLIGFFIAGLLSLFLTKEIVERHLGGRGWWTSLKATLIGIPLPLCSCGVIPVAAALSKQGASRGAVASFLTSTPQTGIDSILATYALMGLPFTAAKVLAALVTGFISGLAVERTKSKASTPKETPSSCCHAQAPSVAEPTPNCCGDAQSPPPALTKDCCTDQPKPPKGHKLIEALRYGFVTLARDIGRSLVVGLLLAGLITTFIPTDFFTGWLGQPFVALIVITLVAVPMYVCATGSIPLAFALMHSGLAPGAVLVFLIAGPATNAVTINTVRQLLGKSATIVYVVTLILCAWGAGALFTLMDFGAVTASEDSHQHIAENLPWWKHASAIILFLVLIPSLIPKRESTSPHH